MQPVTVTENYKRNVYKRKHYSGEMKTYTNETTAKGKDVQ